MSDERNDLVYQNTTEEKRTFNNFPEFHFSMRAFVLIGVVFHCEFGESPFYLTFSCISVHS